MKLRMLTGKLHTHAPTAEIIDPNTIGSLKPNLLMIVPEGKSATILSIPKLETEAPTRNNDELNA